MVNVDAQTQLEAPPRVIHIREGKPKDYRCWHCGRLVMRAILTAGCYIEHRCARCGKICVFEMKQLPTPAPAGDIIEPEQPAESETK